MKINTISVSNPDFPSRLAEIPGKPGTIYSLGKIPEYQLGIAIIGTRKPTAYGRQVTTELVSKLSERGVVIISGLAHGIDGIAHENCLKAGGKTIAVQANGLDQVYPAAHRSMARKILESHGALISEYEPGTPPLQHRFLERNRIVSGLADIVVVTEASLRSGTMNTVNHALEQGKDIYAVPGPITSAMSAGCNRLIAQGASPIVSIDEFIEHLFPKTSLKQITLLAQTPEEQSILDLLAGGISDGEDLRSQSKLSTTNYSQTMTMLEIRGVVRSLGADRWSL